MSLVVGALAAGVSDTAKAAVQDAYEGLKRLVKARFSGRPAVEVALAGHEADPQTWEKPLARALTDSGAVADDAVIAAAQELMRLVDEDGSRPGRYRVDVRGAQGVQVGDHNRQANVFQAPPPVP
ncbi:MAG TPA: hypothetical protein VLJ59_08975 [Mycobacteriales bacterium]|nr:hypothetical protein [Mycobacteriales bacterium]